MINANELRLGNLIYNTKGEIATVNLVGIAYASNEPKNQLQGIPLTEEILLKCGFWKSEWDNNSSFRLEISKTSSMVINNQYVMIGDADLDIEIKYLHQLQNLIYSITNEELQIEL